MKRLMMALLFAGCVVGCAQRVPVLAPNAHMTAQGPEQTQADIDDCIQQAYAQGIAAPRNRDTERAVEGAARGGATGGATGAVTGNAGIAAAVSAIGSGIGGLLDAVLNPTDDDPEGFRAFVETCLRQKGYDPVDWK